MEKQRFFLVRGRGQMVELFCLVAVGIHDKRHSAPRNLKFLVTEVGGEGEVPRPLCLCSRRKMSQSLWSCGLWPVPPVRGT